MSRVIEKWGIKRGFGVARLVSRQHFSIMTFGSDRDKPCPYNVVFLVHLVFLVCLVFLVFLVYLVYIFLFSQLHL